MKSAIIISKDLISLLKVIGTNILDLIVVLFIGVLKSIAEIKNPST
jgi:hypothetical protein